MGNREKDENRGEEEKREENNAVQISFSYEKSSCSHRATNRRETRRGLPSGNSRFLALFMHPHSQRHETCEAENGEDLPRFFSSKVSRNIQEDDKNAGCADDVRLLAAKVDD